MRRLRYQSGRTDCFETPRPEGRWRSFRIEARSSGLREEALSRGFLGLPNQGSPAAWSDTTTRGTVSDGVSSGRSRPEAASDDRVPPLEGAAVAVQ